LLNCRIKVILGPDVLNGLLLTLRLASFSDVIFVVIRRFSSDEFTVVRVNNR
jgi:hypothetical protein